jgi:hypothetical protein
MERSKSIQPRPPSPCSSFHRIERDLSWVGATDLALPEERFFERAVRVFDRRLLSASEPMWVRNTGTGNGRIRGGVWWTLNCTTLASRRLSSRSFLEYLGSLEDASQKPLHVARAADGTRSLLSLGCEALDRDLMKANSATALDTGGYANMPTQAEGHRFRRQSLFPWETLLD